MARPAHGARRREDLAPSRAPDCSELPRRLAASDTDLASHLDGVDRDDGSPIVKSAEHFDWRYYLVKYPAMRRGLRGLRLRQTATRIRSGDARRHGMNGYYRDPFLYAVAIEAVATDDVTGTIEDRPTAPGSPVRPAWRRMRLYGSGVQIRCIPEGFAVALLTDADHPAGFEAVAAAHGVVQTGDGYLLPTPQTTVDADVVDSVDRVQMCATFLRDLLDASL